MLKTLLKQIKQYKKPTILTPIFTALEVIFEVLIPFITAAIIDKGIEAGNMRGVYIYGSIMLIIAFLSLLSGVLAGKYAATASTGFAYNLRDGMYKNIQSFAFSNIDKFSTPSLITRMTTDVTNVQNAFQMSLRIAVRAPLMIVSSMIMSFIISPRLSGIFLVAVLVLALGLIVIMVNVSKVFDQAFKQYDNVNSGIQENVSAIRVVKAYVREKYENEKFEKAVEKMYSLFVKAESLLAFNNPIMMFVVYSSIIGLSWLGAHFIVEGSLTTGELTSMFSYVMSILISLMLLSMVFVMISMSLASCHRIADVLNEKADMANPKEPIYNIENGSIDFIDVDFSYKNGSGEKTLSNINLHINSGETIGIIGGTGSGKSTLVSLISRLYDVTKGKVVVGGHNVCEYDMEALRNQIAVVLQKNTLFSGTILDNLRWGNEKATDEECKEACSLACADEFIEAFPKGYETWIDQGGTNVSGGQKQRLCIARALLKKPKILILDDSTSAVDTSTDKKIREAFEKKIPETTKIIISQRVSGVENCDRIIVLDDGKINGIGTHNELIENNKIYSEIYKIQTENGGDFDQPQLKVGDKI